MTNKEAIYRQDVLDLAKKGVLVSNGNYESVCKAINELPPVNPIEPCGDAIDRAKAIKVASGYCHPANVAKELANLPPVTPQPKTGQWVENDRGISICSCCGKDKYEDIDGSIYDDVWFPNYCPNCGCRMVEPQESEE